MFPPFGSRRRRSFTSYRSVSFLPCSLLQFTDQGARNVDKSVQRRHTFGKSVSDSGGKLLLQLGPLVNTMVASFLKFLTKRPVLLCWSIWRKTATCELRPYDATTIVNLRP